MNTRSVLIVLFDGVRPLDVAGPADVFSTAARFVGEDRPDPYVVRTASIGGRPVRGDGCLQLAADLDLLAVEDPDILVVPGGPGAVERDEFLVQWLRDHARQAGRVMSVCTGAYLLAEAGLLDGGRATTHWAYCDDLASAYPQVQIEPEQIFVRNGAVSTAAGVSTGIDLALAMLEDDLGSTVAYEVARLLVVFLRRPGHQAQLSVQLAAQASSCDALKEVQYWAIDNLDADLSVPALADRAGLSTRQFARVFTAQVGITPGRYVDLIRLEAAQRMLTETHYGVDRVAHKCGYGTAEAMRRAFMRELHLPPTHFRDAFASSAPHLRKTG